VGKMEYEYRFKSAEQFLADYWTDIEKILK
jgi:hypothetical protein